MSDDGRSPAERQREAQAFDDLARLSVRVARLEMEMRAKSHAHEYEGESLAANTLADYLSDCADALAAMVEGR